MSEQCLELKNVCKSFRDFTLNNISFTLPQGYIMGLVGPNGAGKTTTIQLILKMLAGFWPSVKIMWLVKKR